MKINLKSNKLWSFVGIALAMISCILFSISFLNSSHPITYIHSPLLVISLSLLGCSFVGLSVLFYLKKVDHCGESKTLLSIGSIVASLYIAIDLLITFYQNGTTTYLRIFAVLSSVFFFLDAFYSFVHLFGSNNYPVIQFVLHIGSFLGSILYTLVLFFETSLYGNATLKRLLMICFIVIALYYVLELRTSYDPKFIFLYKSLYIVAPALLFSFSFASLLDALIHQQFSFLNLCPYLFLLWNSIYIFLKNTSFQDKQS